MIDTVLNGLLPITLAILLGWLSGRFGYLKREDANVFAVFVLNYALPMTLFLDALSTAPEKLNNPYYILCMAFGLMGTYLVALFTGLYVFRHNLRESTMQALVCAFPDMAYFGAPILQAVVGPAGFFAVLVGNLVTSLIMLPLTMVLTNAADKTDTGHDGNAVWHIFGTSLLRAVRSNIVWLPLLGVALSFLHVKLPAPVTLSLGMIAKASGGTSLFALGLMFYGERLAINADVLANIALKNFLQPALMFLGALALGIKGTLAHELILTGAVPTATAASMFALRYKSYTREASSTILVSTALGILIEAVLIVMF